MIFHIAVCSPDPVLRGRVQRHCMEYYARRADACIVEQLESTAALLRQEKAGSRYELYLIELPAANPCSGLQAAAELRRRGVRAPLAFLAHTTAYAYQWLLESVEKYCKTGCGIRTSLRKRSYEGLLRIYCIQ